MTLELLIKSMLDPKGFDAAKAAAGQMAESIRTGFGIDVGRRLIEGLQRIPAAMKEAVNAGIEFNSTVEDSRIGIAAVLRQFSGDQFKTFQSAFVEAGKAIEALKLKALESPATFGELVRAFQAVSGAATSAGIPLQRQVDLVVLMSQTLAGLGIRSDQIIQESRALLTGNINQDAAAAKILKITAADIRTATEAGRLYEFLTEKMRGFSEAARAGAGSLTTLRSNLVDAFQQQMGTASGPIVDQMKQGITELTQALASPQFQQGLSVAIEHLTILVEAFYKLSTWAVNNVGVLTTLVESFALTVGAAVVGLSLKMGAALAVNPVTAYVAAFVTLVNVVNAAIEKIRLFKAEAALMQTQNALEAQNKSLSLSIQSAISQQSHEGKITAGEWERTMRYLDQLEKMKDAGEASDALRDLAQMVAGRGAAGDKPAGAAAAARANDEADLKTLERAADREHEIQEALTGWYEEEGEKQRQLFLRRRAEAAAAAQAKAEEDAEDLAREQAAFQKLKALQAARKQMEAEELQEDLDALAREQRQRRDDLAVQRAAADADFRVPEQAKKALRIRMIQEEIKALDELIQRLEKRKELEEDRAAKQSIQQQIDAFSTDKRGLQIDLAGRRGEPDLYSFADQFTVKLQDIQDQWGSWASQMADSFASVFNTAISSISNGITGLITGTMTWGEALLNIGRTIVTSIIEAIVQMGVRWVMTQILMATMGKALAAASVAATVPIAAAQAAVWAMPATLSTIATAGGSAAAAPGLIAAANAATLIQALGGAGFKQGDYTGDGNPNDIAGFAHKREFYFTAPQVDRIGLPNLRALAAGRPMAGGGGASGGGGVNVQTQAPQIAILNNEAQVREWLATRAGEKTIVDIVSKNSRTLGLRS